MKKFSLSLVFIFLMGFFGFAQQVTGDLEFKEGRAAGNYAEKKFSKSDKKLFIKRFNVNFQLIYVDAEQTREGVYHGSTSSSITVGFEGVTEQDLQAITDKLYNDYVAKMQAAGYQIVTAAEAAGIKEHSEYVAQKGGGISKAQLPGYATCTPTGYEYFVKKVTASGKEKGAFVDKSNKISGQLGAVVVNVDLNIPFMTDGESGASKLATGVVGGVSKVVAKPNLRLDQTGTNMNYVDAGQGCNMNIPMKGNLQINGVFEDEKFKSIAGAKSNSSYSMGYATIVVSEKVDVSNIQVAKCDPAKYIKGVQDATSMYMDGASDVFLGWATK